MNKVHSNYYNSFLKRQYVQQVSEFVSLTLIHTFCYMCGFPFALLFSFTLQHCLWCVLCTSYGMRWDLRLLPDVSLEALVTNGMFSRININNSMLYREFSAKKPERTKRNRQNLFLKFDYQSCNSILHLPCSGRTDWLLNCSLLLFIFGQRCEKHSFIYVDTN